MGILKSHDNNVRIWINNKNKLQTRSVDNFPHPDTKKIMAYDILYNMWLAGAALLLFALSLKLGFSRAGLWSRRAEQTAAQLELAGRLEHARRLKTRRFKYTTRSELYFWPLVLNAAVLMAARFAIAG